MVITIRTKIEIKSRPVWLEWRVYIGHKRKMVIRTQLSRHLKIRRFLKGVIENF